MAKIPDPRSLGGIPFFGPRNSDFQNETTRTWVLALFKPAIGEVNVGPWPGGSGEATRNNRAHTPKNNTRKCEARWASNQVGIARRFVPTQNVPSLRSSPELGVLSGTSIPGALRDVFSELHMPSRRCQTFVCRLSFRGIIESVCRVIVKA